MNRLARSRPAAPILRPTRRHLIACAAALAALPCTGAQAADTAWPEKTVTLVMPFATGGMGDTLARVVGEQLAREWKQTVVIDNRAGAGGMIGNQAVARAAPDGYTLLMSISQLVQAPALGMKVPYDVQKDFVPLVRVAGALSIFATTDPAIKSLKDYITLAQANAAKYPYGTYGAGTSSHIYAEVFNAQHKIKATQIPYKGAAPLLTDMMGGQVPVAFTDLATTLPHIRSGKVKVFAVTGPRRSAALPDVPTFAEQGASDMDVVGWYGMFAPAKTPKDVVDKIRTTLDKVLRLPEVQAKLSGFGLEPPSGPPEDFAKRIENDLAYWRRVVNDNHIKAE
jgi:tripartite-type tricarboxylate transporter receptor subunit TctC